MGKLTFPSTKTDTLSVPWDSSQAPVKKYEPVDCDFTDELEFIAVKKISVEVKYWNSQGSNSLATGLIKDIETANKEEHLIMSGGERIRLDHLIQLRIPNL